LVLSLYSDGGQEMTIRPLHDHVIVRRKEEQHISTGGIVIPDSATEKPQWGEVVAAGNGRVLANGKVAAVEVGIGDEVLFGKYAGTEIKLDDEQLLVMHESDILALLET